MKKILSGVSILTILALLLALTGCGGGGAGKNTSSAGWGDGSANPVKIDIKQYASQGQVYPLPIKLGDSVQKVNDTYGSGKTSSDGSAWSLEVGAPDDNGNIPMTVGGTTYYYRTDEKDKGIFRIVTYDTFYGLDRPVQADDIKAALGPPESTATPTVSDTRFIPDEATLSKSTRLRYVYGNYRLDFIVMNLADSSNCACVLTDTSVWGA